MNPKKNAAEMNENIQDNQEEQPFDYDHVKSVARIAAYDDLKSAPRVTLIEPAPTDEFIMNLATKVYEQAKMMGGKIPFTIIKEVSENFIHAKFAEMTVTILDEGNTIRFADQGPGINHKDKVKLPGFSSAVEPMKQYIRGVGSGLPIVQDYFDEKHGTVTIDDNILRGAVVTISLKETDDEFEGEQSFEAVDYQAEERHRNFAQLHEDYVQQTAPTTQQMNPQTPYPLHQAGNGYYQSFAAPAQQAYQQAYPQQNTAPQPLYPQNAFQQGYQQNPYPAMDYQQQGYQQQNVTMVGNGHRVPMHLPQVAALSERGKLCLKAIQSEGVVGVTEVAKMTGIPQSTVYNELKRLEEAGLVEQTNGKKRMLTAIGLEAVNSF